MRGLCFAVLMLASPLFSCGLVREHTLDVAQPVASKARRNDPRFCRRFKVERGAVTEREGYLDSTPDSADMEIEILQAVPLHEFLNSTFRKFVEKEMATGPARIRLKDRSSGVSACFSVPADYEVRTAEFPDGKEEFPTAMTSLVSFHSPRFMRIAEFIGGRAEAVCSVAVMDIPKDFSFESLYQSIRVLESRGYDKFALRPVP